MKKSALTLQIMSNTLTNEQNKEISYAYNVFDPNNNGYIDANELCVLMKSIGFVISKNELQKILDDKEIEDDNVINKSVVEEIVREKMLQRDPLDEIKYAFELFDIDHTGKISVANLKKIAYELEENISETDLEAMINEFDKDHDGQISQAEFIDIMRTK